MQKEKQLKSCCKNSLSSREVVARDLPHPMPLFNEKKQPCFTRDVEDPRTLRAARCTPPTSGMTGLFYHGNNGFTLIELLVVVLIIGILAAVALPQYQKAVHKSRIAAMLPLMRSIKNAQESYYLANGEYAVSFDDLEVSLPAGCQIYHTYGNMFYCQDWLVDNEINDVVTGRLKLSYCPNVPEKSADYRLCNTYALMRLTLYYDYADEISKRGTLSCTASEAGLCAAFN